MKIPWIFNVVRISLLIMVGHHISPDLVRLLRLTGFGAMEVAAEGSWVIDQTGRRYLDFSGGYGVFSLGHRHPKVVEAVKDQLDKIALSSRVCCSSRS